MPGTNVFRVTINQQMYGQTFQNVMHFNGPSADPAQMEALATQIRDSWILEVRTMQHDKIAYVSVVVRLLESQFAPFTLPMSILGTRSGGDQEHTFLAHIVRIRTGLIGRHNSGRIFVGGLRNDTTFNGQLNAAYLNDWTNRLATLQGIFCLGGSSDFDLGVTRKVGPTANFVTAVRLEISPRPGVQRRREVGVGI